MASRLLELLVRAKDEASKTLDGIGGSLSGIKKAAQQAESAMYGVISAATSLQGILVGAGIGLFVKSFIDAAKEVEGYRMQLRILTGDQARGNALFKEAAEYASKVTFEYRDIIGVVTQLRGVIKGSDQEVMTWVKLVGDVAAATGMDIRTTTEQISRMYSAGAQSAELFKERGKLAMLEFQVGVSYSAEATRKQLMDMWTKVGSAINGAAFDLANTWDGLLSMIADKWFQFRSVFMEQSGLFAYLKAWLKWYIAALDEMYTEDTLAKWAKHTGEVVISVFEKMASAVGYLGNAFQVMGAAIGTAGTIIAYVGELLLDLYEYATNFTSGIRNMFTRMAEFLRAVAESGIKPDFIAEAALENAIVLEGIVKRLGIEIERSTGRGQALREAMQELGMDSARLLQNMIDTTPMSERLKAVLSEVHAIMVGITQEQGRQTGGIDNNQKKMVKLSQTIKDAMDKFKAEMGLEKAMLESTYAQRLITTQEYYDKRRLMIQQQYEQERKTQREMLKTPEVAEDPNKIADIKTKIYELEKKEITEIIELEQKRREAQKTDVERERDRTKIIQDIKDRTLGIGENTLTATFDKELRDLDNRHAEEIKKLRDLRATETEINDAYRAQELEKERLLSDQRRRLQEAVVTQGITMFGNWADAAGKMYELSGKKAKEYFYIQKAALIAQAIMQTYQGATGAFSAMSGIPYVGPFLGAAAAAAAIALGLANVAMIVKQTAEGPGGGKAEGGIIEGRSPTTRSDNIPIRATAGEYIHPVGTVQYYGKPIMEALRRRTIPRSLFAGMGAPGVNRPMTGAFATGGLVSAPLPGGDSRIGAEDRLTINNILDPQLLGQYLASTVGERQVLNIISNNRFSVKTILAR